MKSILSALALAGLIAMPAVAQDFGPPELIAAAKKEGRLVYYTANFAEVEQEVIKAFNKRFPEIRVEMVRAPLYYSRRAGLFVLLCVHLEPDLAITAQPSLLPTLSPSAPVP